MTLSELRAMILELRPAPLERQGLSEALRVSMELFTRHQQIEADLDLSYGTGLTPEQEIAVYRIVQEALANIRRHAQADRIGLYLREKENRVELKVTDNGSGFVPERVMKGNGLFNMKIRARENGGVFRLQTSPGHGTTITVAFPKG